MNRGVTDELPLLSSLTPPPRVPHTADKRKTQQRRQYALRRDAMVTQGRSEAQETLMAPLMRAFHDNSHRAGRGRKRKGRRGGGESDG